MIHNEEIRVPVADKETIEKILSAEMLRFAPTFTLLAAIFVFGAVGNGLVFYIYKTRYPRSNTRLFILFLSSVDFFACVIAVPVHLLSIPNSLYTSIICKTSGFLDAVGTVSTLFMLISIAFERYKKICRPLSKQLSLRMVTLLCSSSIVMGMLIAVSNLFIYGRKTVELRGYAIPLVECSVADDMEQSHLPTVTFIVYGLIFLLAAGSITGFYFCAVRAIFKQVDKMYVFSSSRSASQSEISSLKVSTKEHKKRPLSRNWSFNRIRERMSSSSFAVAHEAKKDEHSLYNKDIKPAIETTDGSATKSQKIEPNTDHNMEQDQSKKDSPCSLDVKQLQEEETMTENIKATPVYQSANLTTPASDFTEHARVSRPQISITFTSTSDITTSVNGSRGKVLLRKVSPSSRTSLQTLQSAGRRSVLMMLAVSLTFVMCYLPVLVLLVMRNVNKELENGLSNTQYIFYRLFLRSYFVNFAVNPVIYGICDRRFRQICRDVFCKCKMSSDSVDNSNTCRSN